MSTNLFAALKRMLPDSPVWIGEVVAHNDTDDTSTIRLPTGQGDIPFAGAVQGGSLIRARGRTVPVGEAAFVRDGLVENRAPSGTPIEYVVAPVTLVAGDLTVLAGGIPAQSGAVGVAFTLDSTAYVTGGTQPLTWSVAAGTLPAGLSLDAATGVISGTPTTEVTGLSVTLRATDAQLRTVDLSVVFTVAAAGSLTLTGTVPNPITAYMGRQSAALLMPLGSQLTAVNLASYITGGTAPITWSTLSAAPSGWTVTDVVFASGSASSLPSPGSVTARATDSLGATVDIPLNLAVASPLLSTDTGAVDVPATIGTPLTLDLSTRHTGGVGAVTYSVLSGTVPTGLTLNTTTGILSGTPTNTGDFPMSLTIRSTDSQDQTFFNIFTLQTAGSNSWSGLNQNAGSGTLVLSGSDKTATFSGAADGEILAVLSSSDIGGLAYCEFELVSRTGDGWFHFFGLVETSAAPNLNSAGNYGIFTQTPAPGSNIGGKVEGTGFVGYNDTFAFLVGDRIGVAYNATTRALHVRRNGTWLGGTPPGASPFATLPTGTYRFAYTAVTQSAVSPGSVVRIYSGAEQTGSLPSGYTRY